MNNNTKIRLRLSKNLFESLTREILAEAKKGDMSGGAYTEAVKMPKAGKMDEKMSSKEKMAKGLYNEVGAEEVTHGMKKEATPTGTSTASKLGANLIDKGREVKSLSGLSGQEIKTIQSILDLIVNKAPEGETALALQKALTILTQNTKNIEDKGQPGSTTSPSAMNAAGYKDKPAIPGLREKKMKEMETMTAEEKIEESVKKKKLKK